MPEQDSEQIPLTPFPELKLGEPVPWQAVHNGIEYNGELLLSNTWRGELGRKIEREDVHFRIVTLTKQQRVPLKDIEDERLAVCIPAQPSPEAKRLDRKYRTIREKRATYTAEEQELIAKLLREQTSSYAAGCIITKSQLPIEPEQVFSADDNQIRFDLIASALLANAYPDSPIDALALSKPISAKTPGLVFNGFFGPQDDLEAKKALEDFAVALGLAQPDNPDKFAPQNCPVFAILAAELKEHGDSLAIPDLYRKLATHYGLPRNLITLYLLCFVHHGHPVVELRLKPDHGLVLRCGERFAQNELTAPYIAEVRWRGELWQDWQSLGYSKEPLWNVTLPYARAIEQTFTASTTPEEIKHQEGLLLAKIEELETTLEQTTSMLKLMTAGLGPPPDKEVLAAVERLSHLSRCKSYQHFYQTVQQEYRAPSALAEDMSLHRRLCQLSEIAPEVLKVKAYLDSVVLRESDGELTMDRLSLLEQLTLDNLLAAPHLWPSIEALFDWFKPRYGDIYQSFHSNYNRELASLHSGLLAVKVKLEALHRLNSITELGPPLAEELWHEYETLLAEARPCSATKVPIEEQPLCPYCGLTLNATPPRKIEQFLDRLHQALREQHRRLSAEAIRQILSQDKEHRVDQFIKVIQTSDLSSLANVLDDELVAFLRQLLAEAETTSQWCPILKTLSQKFPAIEEGQIDELLSEFARELRSAFDLAKKQNPGKRVWIIIE
jgi:hypothetical protein